MKIKIITGLSIALLSIYSNQVQATTQTTESKQILVERSLTLPIQFTGEEAQRFSVKERMAHYHIPGFSFALINNRKIEWSRGYGTLETDSKVPVTSETLFQAASIAKPVTAYAMMRMHEQELVDINKDIKAYLGSFKLAREEKAGNNSVTMKMLLAHTSGITPGGYLGYEKGELVPSDEQVFLGQEPASSKAVKVESVPGEMVKYSGAGYTLTEIILQKVFKKSFEELMNYWVLKGNSMTQSTFSQSLTPEQQARTASGHDSSGQTVKGGWRIHPEQAAAGLWSTPTDLAKFAIEISNAYHGKSKALTQRSARELLSPVLEDKDLSDSFGGQPAITFVVNGEGDEFMFSHGGGNVGYRSYLVMYPNTGKGAVFMANSDAGYGVGMEMLRSVSRIYDWPNFKSREVNRRVINKQSQTQLIGVYHFESGWQAKIVSSGQASGIAIEFPNGDLYPLSAIEGEHSYVHQDTGVEARFSKANGERQLHLYNQIGRMTVE